MPPKNKPVFSRMSLAQRMTRWVEDDREWDSEPPDHQEKDVQEETILYMPPELLSIIYDYAQSLCLLRLVLWLLEHNYVTKENTTFEENGYFTMKKEAGNYAQLWVDDYTNRAEWEKCLLASHHEQLRKCASCIS